MPSLIITLPLLPGKREAWRRFCQEMAASRREAYEASRRRLGITQERFSLVETTLGTAVVITIEAPDVGRALTALAASDVPFDRWFKAKLQALHGFSLGTRLPDQDRLINCLEQA